MVKCPHCDNEVNKPSKELKNHIFTLQAYNCNNCHNNFKVSIDEAKYTYI